MRFNEVSEEKMIRAKLREVTEFKNSTLGRSTEIIILDGHDAIRQIQDLEALVQNQQIVDQPQGNQVNQSSLDTAFMWYIHWSVGRRPCVARLSTIGRS